MSGDSASGTWTLREKLLSAKPSDFGLAATPELPRVWAALMEMRMSKANVSLVAVAEGSTSLYISTGGGVIGAGEHDPVRDGNRKLLTFIETALDLFVPIERPLEVFDDAVSFVVLTYEGLRGARDEEKKLEDRRSPLWPAYYLGQDVITKMRLATGKTTGR
jgi:hypothetical protein